MTKSNCEQLKTELQSIKSGTWKVFLERFSREGRFDGDYRLHTNSINALLKVLASEIHVAFTETPNGKKFPSTKYHMASNFDKPVELEANIRKQYEVSKVQVLKIGDVIRRTDIQDSPPYTVVGFEIETNAAIVSITRSSMKGLRKKTKYLSLSDGIVLRDEDNK